MNALQQFLALLNEKIVDNDELKTELTGAFAKVESTFNTNNDQRKDLGKKADNLASLNKFLSEKFGLEDVNEDNISDAVTALSKSGNDDIEALKKELGLKHESDLDILRTEIKTEQDKFTSLNGKFSTMQSSNAIETLGLLKGFKTENPRVKAMLTDEIMGKLIFNDDGVFVNDGSGGIATDITTGKNLDPISVRDGMIKSNDWNEFVNPDIQAQGGGSPQGGGNPPPAEIDASKHTNVNSFMSEAMANIKK